MDSYIIQTQPQDELTVVIDKIIHTQAERVYLLVPEKSRIAQQALNFRLLKREADALGKEIIIVSGNPRVQTLALKASLQVHQETLELKEGAAKERKNGVLKPPRLADIITAVPSDQVARKPQKQKEKQEAKQEVTQAQSSKYAFLSATQAQGTDAQKRKEPPLIEKKSVSEAEKEIARFWTKRPALPPSFKLGKILPITKEALPKTIFSPKLATFFARLEPFLQSLSRIVRPPLGWNTAKTLRAVFFLFVGISSIVAGFTFYSVLPKAKIFITPLSEEVLLEVAIQGNTNISAADPLEGMVPGQIFERAVESSRNIITTGEKEIRNKSSGILRVYNAYSSAPQTLVATTRFVSESGKLFRTTQTIVVPGAKVEEGKIVPNFITVNVTASEPGEEYNIGPATFSIPGFKGTPKYLGFYGESQTAMTGGKIGRVKVVTEDDYYHARDELIRELQERSAREIGISIPDGFIIPQGATEFSDVKISAEKAIGDIADEFLMSGSILMQSFAVRENDVAGLLGEDFIKKFPGKNLVLDGEKTEYKTIEVNFDEGMFDIQSTRRQKAAAIIDEDEIRQGVRGKQEREVRSFLAAYPGIKEARVTFWPFWVHKVQDDIGKIEVVVEL